MKSVVIIGAGHAGFHCAAALRQQGFKGDVTLIGDEEHLPYQRPPLSKGYLLGSMQKADLGFRPLSFFESNQVRMILDSVVTIDRSDRRVQLQSGDSVKYDHLVLATGSCPRRLSVQGAELAGIFYLHTLADADRLRGALQASTRVVTIGAGFIGLEFASSARSLGNAVTVVDVADRPMSRVLSPLAAESFTEHHQSRGMQWLMKTSVQAFELCDGSAPWVLTSDGRRLPADTVVVGVGGVPRVELARQCGLEVNDGVVVDAALVTSDPHISAIGDIARFPYHQTGQSIRLESVQNANDQARSVASRLAGRSSHPYQAVPWFWSDQGDLKLQIAGLRPEGADCVRIGDAKGFSVLCMADGELCAVESVNRPTDHMMARKILSKRTPLSRQEAMHPDFNLMKLLH
jgi:3-phenylpropionate/trans-cinnamate dioxygenase ferredoxin reductase component